MSDIPVIFWGDWTIDVPDIATGGFSVVSLINPKNPIRNNDMGNAMDGCAVFIFDATYRFRFADMGARRHSGYTGRQLAAMSPWDLKPDFTECEFRHRVAPLMAGEAEALSLDTVHRRADGALVPVSESLRRLSCHDMPHVLALVTERPVGRGEATARREAIRLRNSCANLIDRREAMCRLATTLGEIAGLVETHPAMVKENLVRLERYFTTLSLMSS